jgi:uncharacterized protein YbaP (TraB family)
MRLRWLHFLVGIFLGFATFSAVAKGPLWQVSKGKHHLFIGGTIHLLGQQDYPLPSEFDWAYTHSDLIVFEVDPESVNTPEAQQKFMAYALYTDGRNLQQLLDEDTYTALNNFMAVRGMSIDAFSTMKPGMLSVLLTVIELQRLGLAGEGVDTFYSKRALVDGKPRRALETLDEQFTAMQSLGEGKESQVILHTLNEIDQLSVVMDKMKQAWRRGDNQALVDVAMAPWVEQFPSLYQALLVERNHRWLSRLDAFMRTSEVEYVLVGALHLVGPDGVLAMLRAKGYKVRALEIPKVH